jgi:hypothetical protein
VLQSTGAGGGAAGNRLYCNLPPAPMEEENAYVGPTATYSNLPPYNTGGNFAEFKINVTKI